MRGTTLNSRQEVPQAGRSPQSHTSGQSVGQWQAAPSGSAGPARAQPLAAATAVVVLRRRPGPGRVAAYEHDEQERREPEAGEVQRAEQQDELEVRAHVLRLPSQGRLRPAG